MLANNKDKGEEFVEKNYAESIKELTWHLIKEQLIKAQNIKVDDNDLMETAKEAARAQFAQYGMLSIPEDVLDNYSKEMLKNKETVQNIVDRAMEEKLAACLKEKVTIDLKELTAEEFAKLFE